MSFFVAQHALFRAYDIRGDEHYFTPDFIEAVGNAFVRLYQRQPTSAYPIGEVKYRTTTVIVGFDVRCGSDKIAKQLAAILQEQGLQVLNLGLITTPMMAFWTEQYNGHGIMVTASHSAKGILGIKWLVSNNSPSAQDIQALYHDLIPVRAQDKTSCTRARRKPYNINEAAPVNTASNVEPPAYISSSTNTDNQSLDDSKHFNSANDVSKMLSVIGLPTDIVAAPYIEAIAEVFTTIYPEQNLSATNRRTIKKLDLTIVIDCMHGATSRIAAPLFTSFCQRVIIINDRPDGSFPMGNPDPTEPNRLAELQQTVIVNDADIGLAFDGDGDRLMIVDNSGKVVASDHLLYLLAKVAITQRPKSLGIDDSNIDTLTPHCSSLSHKKLAAKALSIKDKALQAQLLQAQALESQTLKNQILNSIKHTTADSKTVKAATIATPQVLFDIKCSHHLAPLLSTLGAEPIISKTGSSLMRQQLQSNDSPIVFAGELSGHFIFNDSYFTVYDDAMYAGLRLLHWLAYTAAYDETLSADTDVWGEPISAPPYQLTDVTDQLPKLVSTADHYLPIPQTAPMHCSVVKQLTQLCAYLLADTNTKAQSDASLDTCLSSDCTCVSVKAQTELEAAKHLLPQDTKLTCIDGVRLDFKHGFGIVRQSNTSHNLTVRFAGDSVTDLKAVQDRFVKLCQRFDPTLATQIAAIRPA